MKDHFNIRVCKAFKNELDKRSKMLILCSCLVAELAVVVLLELVSKELNHLPAILHVYAGG